jgi:hypothetical protein
MTRGRSQGLGAGEPGRRPQLDVGTDTDMDKEGGSDESTVARFLGGIALGSGR